MSSIKKYLSTYAEQVNKVPKKKFKRLKVIVNEPLEEWGMDLSDMSKLAEWNDGVHFILTCVDCFSRKAQVIPVKNKSGKEIFKALLILFKHEHPKKLWIDSGKEWFNKDIMGLCKKLKIELFSTGDDNVKSVFAESFNKTIKRMIYKKMQEEDDFNYIQYIPLLVKEYNNRVHSAFRRLKLTPTQVHNGSKQLIGRVKKELYGEISNNLVQVPKFKRGDNVRVALKK